MSWIFPNILWRVCGILMYIHSIMYGCIVKLLMILIQIKIYYELWFNIIWSKARNNVYRLFVEEDDSYQLRIYIIRLVHPIHQLNSINGWNVSTLHSLESIRFGGVTKKTFIIFVVYKFDVFYITWFVSLVANI